jgi:hypothetical protein
MGSKLGHEAGVTGTAARRSHEHDDYVRGVAPTHVDSPNPIGFLLGTECSPLPAYDWLSAGARFIRARHADCGPKDSQSDGKEPQDEHS